MSNIKIENTKNDEIVKFVFDKILTQNSFEYNSIDDADNSCISTTIVSFTICKKSIYHGQFHSYGKV